MFLIVLGLVAGGNPAGVLPAPRQDPSPQRRGKHRVLTCFRQPDQVYRACFWGAKTTAVAVASAYHGILHFSLAGPLLSSLQDGHVPAAIQQYGECIAAMLHYLLSREAQLRVW